MKNLLKIFFLFIFVSFLLSCGSMPKLVSKTQSGEAKVKFFYVSNPNPSKAYKSFYAKVDSNNFQTYYTFQTQNIYKEKKNSNGLIFTLVYDINPNLHLTALDSFVLDKADYFMDSLGRKDLKKAKGATGFVTEVKYH